MRPGAPQTEFIIAAAPLRPWPLQDFGEIEQILQTRVREGYRVIFAQEGWTVLQKP